MTRFSRRTLLVAGSLVRRARFQAIPWDLWFSFGSILIYTSSLIFTALGDLIGGPALCILIALPLLVGSSMVLAWRNAFGTRRWFRSVALVIVAVCLVSLCSGSLQICKNVYVARRIDRAGGPDAISEWAQGLMQRIQPNEPDRRVEDDEIPSGVKTHLSRNVRASEETVTIALGGGFYSYGIVIKNRRAGDPPKIYYYFE